MASNTQFLPAIDKLLGRINYMTWKFAVKAYMEHEGLWNAILGTEREQEKLVKAKSKLILLINPVNFVHIQSCNSAHEIWKQLKQTFDDAGLMRRVTLIRVLATTKLSDCSSMEAYIQLLMNTAHQLREINVTLNDEWVGTFMLAGLPDSYSPMIMALENSGIPISADAIKTKLLQEFTPSDNCNSSKVFYTNKKQLSQRRIRKNSYKKPTESSVGKNDIQCFTCRLYGHKSFDCPKKKKNPNEKSPTDTPFKRGAFVVCPPGISNDDDWFIDSASSFHMTPRDDWIVNNTEKPIEQILAANNSTMQVTSAGEIIVDIERNGVESQVSISNVLHVQDLSSNLLSVSQLCQKGHKVIFTNEGCEIFDKDSYLVATGRHVNNMFVLNLSPNRCLFTSVNKQSLLWHRRLGHLNLQDLCKLKSAVMEFNSPKTVES